jgi:hypothetical protein
MKRNAAWIYALRSIERVDLACSDGLRESRQGY